MVPRYTWWDGAYHMASTSPAGPAAMIGPSSEPKVSSRRRYLRLPHSDQSVVDIMTLVNWRAELQYGQSRIFYEYFFDANIFPDVHGLSPA